ncbi:MAG: hypothetical protein IJD14_01375, partial [Christensenellaceae bacterium]|nr:hypothetical protein [Christensenellaceae bacterium]
MAICMEDSNRIRALPVADEASIPGVIGGFKPPERIPPSPPRNKPPSGGFFLGNIYGGFEQDTSA